MNELIVAPLHDDSRECSFCRREHDPLEAFYRVEWHDGRERVACYWCLRDKVPKLYWKRVYREYGMKLIE